ncbi:MATE family efflux transporter [Ihubacter sp. rT4E-8]|uniref:MATE family efflux transporter n=1 Tax=unclassified Ihubacter TaxID=2633299 RepID=UPI00137A1448
MENESKKVKKTFEIDMVRGPVLMKMLIFTLPLMLSSILQLLFNAADIIVVGRFAGDNSLAAVGSNTALIGLMTNLFIGLSVGANVTVARYFGGRKREELSDTVHTTMALSLISGIALTVIGMILSKYFLMWMGTPDEVLPLATEYLRIYFLGMTGMMVYNFGGAILRAVGDTRRPLYYLAFSGVVNVGLNLFFVISLKMDVAGVGAATAISQWISAVLIFRCLIREQSDIRLTLRNLRVHGDKVMAILRIGLPAGVQGMIFSLTNVLIQASVNSFGATVVAGSSAAANIEGFIYFAMNAFYQATISFTSQNIGARRIKRIDKILGRGEMCVVAVGLIMGSLAVLFGRQLLGIYTSSDIVIDAGMERLRIIALTYALGGAMDVMVGALRGMGYSIIPMVVTLVGVCGLRVFWILTIFQMPAFHTVEMLFLTYPVTWTVTLSGHIITFFIARKKLREQAIARKL